ncbi:MAG: hypothetical protein NVSMB46_07850 [Candidatus Saccharimonadales bacterium]
MAGLQKILLVEDNYQLQQIYSFLLKKHGFDLAVASNGQEALEKAKSFEPELVFLDIMIPFINGMDVLKILRRDPQYNCTKARIVLLTNLGDENQLSDAWQKDADGYVIKAEIIPQDLLEIISSFSPGKEKAPPSTLNQ